MLFEKWLTKLSQIRSSFHSEDEWRKSLFWSKSKNDSSCYANRLTAGIMFTIFSILVQQILACYTHTQYSWGWWKCKWLQISFDLMVALEENSTHEKSYCISSSGKQECQHQILQQSSLPPHTRTNKVFCVCCQQINVEDPCIICHDDMSPDSVCVLGCRHSFHNDVSENKSWC